MLDAESRLSLSGSSTDNNTAALSVFPRATASSRAVEYASEALITDTAGSGCAE